MAADPHPCSRCPILDLGNVYPVGDQRDPWRRMPKLFRQTVVIFGRGMYSHTGRTRLRLEKLFGHYCRVQREKYGPCTTRRVHLCSGILQDAVTSAHGKDQPHGWVTTVLRNVVNDDATAEKMRSTVVKPGPYPGIRVPVASFREVPDA